MMNREIKEAIKTYIKNKLCDYPGIGPKTADECISHNTTDYIIDDGLGRIVDDIYQQYQNRENKITSLAEKLVISKPDMTEEWIRSAFHFLPDLSDSESKVFARRIPVCRYDGISTLEAEIRAWWPEKQITVECFDTGTTNPYAAFYHVEYGDYTRILKEIENKIRKELRKIGVDDGKNGKRPSKRKTFAYHQRNVGVQQYRGKDAKKSPNETRVYSTNVERRQKNSN